jgi:hypothetical protein
MKLLPCDTELLALAPRIVWFEEPEQALANPIRFLAYLMTYGTFEDVAIVKRYVGQEGFEEALEKAPAGIIDKRSWAYWNAMVGRYPVPPMPQRKLPD